MNVEILLFDGFDELDAFGPWEVFAGIAHVSDLVTAAFVTLEGARPVRGDHGATVMAHRALSTDVDLLIVPGGGWLDRSLDGAWGEVIRGDLPKAIAARHDAGTVVASVCTGALIVAASGALAGHRATTNPSALDELRAADRTIEVVAARVVDDGSVVTAGAPSCGLDLSVHLVRRFFGDAVGGAVIDALQYTPPRVDAVEAAAPAV